MATWVIGDIHGCYNEFKLLLDNPLIAENDTIILIGDIIDRGPNSYKMLNWAMQNITPNGKYQMICGNHEDNIIYEYSLVKRRAKDGYYRDWQTDKVIDFEDLDITKLNSQYDFDTYMYSAGFETVCSIKDIIEWFISLPLIKKVEVEDKKGHKKKYIIAHAWYSKDINREGILWDRDVNSYNELTEDYISIEGEKLIHGHTPTLCINKCKNKVVNEVLFRKNSINIDCGCVFEKYGGNLAAIRLEDEKVIYARKQEKIKP